MRAVVQRVGRAAVEVEGGVCGSVESGLLVYLGVGCDDGEADTTYLADKIRHLRIFRDEADRMNLDVVQACGEVLVVSAFTVQADARKGRRPSLEAAAPKTGRPFSTSSFATPSHAPGCKWSGARLAT
jgi:D-tyrosyl-tRNA(Tyr) deacylase